MERHRIITWNKWVTH